MFNKEELFIYARNCWKVVEGTVTGITSFGAFVQLPKGESGLVHISEISDDYVEK